MESDKILQQGGYTQQPQPQPQPQPPQPQVQPTQQVGTSSPPSLPMTTPPPGGLGLPIPIMNSAGNEVWKSNLLNTAQPQISNINPLISQQQAAAQQQQQQQPMANGNSVHMLPSVANPLVPGLSGATGQGAMYYQNATGGVHQGIGIPSTAGMPMAYLPQPPGQQQTTTTTTTTTTSASATNIPTAANLASGSADDKRPRGRPRKNPPTVPKSPTLPKRKRGRPLKLDKDGNPMPKPVITTPGKKRGRPKKLVGDDDDELNSSTNFSDSNDTPTKKRGRPPKQGGSPTSLPPPDFQNIGSIPQNPNINMNSSNNNIPRVQQPQQTQPTQPQQYPNTTNALDPQEFNLKVFD